MKKIYYNAEGYICELYPYLPVTEDCRCMEITDELYGKITVTPKDHAWKVVDGECLCVDMRTRQEKESDELDKLRERRARECSDLVNRGKLWFDMLDFYQKEQPKAWYVAWLDVTDTQIIPDKPRWLK